MGFLGGLRRGNEKTPAGRARVLTALYLNRKSIVFAFNAPDGRAGELENPARVVPKQKEVRAVAGVVVG